MYTAYLKSVGLKQSKMSLGQNRELRRAFFGACGMMMVKLRDDIGTLPEDQAVKVLEDMFHQVNEFFLKENNKLN
jgi:hypothetical protein